MDTYEYIWGPKSQSLAQKWRQGPWTMAHLGPPPVLGQGLTPGSPYVSTCVHMYAYVSMCPYVSHVLYPVSIG